MFVKRLFVHIPKNAGMTIRRSPQLRDKIILSTPAVHKNQAYTNGVLNQMNKIGDHHGFEHARWRDLNPAMTSGHDAFAIVRNPWDRVASRYFFAQKVIYHEVYCVMSLKKQGLYFQFLMLMNQFQTLMSLLSNQIYSLLTIKEMIQ